MDGDPVGYSQGPRLPAEFDVTHHVTPGQNTVPLRVLEFPDGSSLEDRDMRWLSGSSGRSRSYTIPEVGIADPDVRTGLDGGYVDADRRVEAELVVPDGGTVRTVDADVQVPAGGRGPPN